MAGTKRERELARAKYERQRARRAEESAKRRRRNQVVVAVVVSVAVVGAVIGIQRLVASNSAANAETLPSATPSVSDTTTPSTSSSPVPTDGSDVSCTYSASQDASKPVSVPPTTAPTKPATATATITLNGKPVTVSLLRSKAPCTVNSFAHLATAKWFDGTTCHRLTSGDLSVLQCGDPSGTGSGGPGYTFADENLTGATYPAGTLAMANSGTNTNGSQFFLVYKDSTGLPPAYTPFGKVTAGLDVLQAIAAKGIAGGGSDGAPAQTVTVDSIRVKG